MKRKMPLFLGCAAALLVGASFALPGSVLGQLTGRADMPRPLTNVLVLGDSFAGDRAFQQRLRELLPQTAIRFDAVGGSSLQEQLQRLEANPVAPGEALVILDGGLTDPDPAGQVAAITQTLGDACAIWRYIEPVQRATPENFTGSRRWLAQERRVAAVEERFPGHVVRVMDRLRELPPETQADRDDVARGWVARSWRRDRVHLSEAGFAALAEMVADSLQQARETPCEAG